MHSNDNGVVETAYIDTNEWPEYTPVTTAVLLLGWSCQELPNSSTRPLMHPLCCYPIYLPVAPAVFLHTCVVWLQVRQYPDFTRGEGETWCHFGHRMCIEGHT
jgi:hypothetical protein